jgi:hypothetical protein
MISVSKMIVREVEVTGKRSLSVKESVLDIGHSVEAQRGVPLVW